MANVLFEKFTPLVKDPETGDVLVCEDDGCLEMFLFLGEIRDDGELYAVDLSTGELKNYWDLDIDRIVRSGHCSVTVTEHRTA